MNLLGYIFTKEVNRFSMLFIRLYIVKR